MYAALAALLLSGCSTHLTDVSMISNKSVELESINIDKAPQRKLVEGSSTKFIFLIIPFGYPTIKEALNNALEKGQGDLMVDASIYREGWWFLVGQDTIKIKGTVVNTKGAK
ncbi:MAG: hypothetical protein DI585_04060 [Pseudomonas fluorescens]|nr:MAG: hypothetical protein DI585_04060 [Pseudomonas fluorescens]